MGQKLNFLAAVKSSLLPPKNSLSVSIERADAPACIYPIEVRSIETEALIIPLEGDLRLISAMMPDLSFR